MEKERRITAPEGCEIEKVKLIDGAAVVTFREKEWKLQKSWKEFCAINPLTSNDCFITADSSIGSAHVLKSHKSRRARSDKNLLPNFETAEAVLALCQLIQLRNAYNGDWLPDYKTADTKWTIEFEGYKIVKNTTKGWPCILTFKSEELRDEFLRNFSQLIEKLKPLYGIKEEQYIKVEERGGKE